MRARSDRVEQGAQVGVSWHYEFGIGANASSIKGASDGEQAVPEKVEEIIEVVVLPVPEVVPEAVEGGADLRRWRRSETLCISRSGWFSFLKSRRRSMKWSN